MVDIQGQHGQRLATGSGLLPQPLTGLGKAAVVETARHGVGTAQPVQLRHRVTQGFGTRGDLVFAFVQHDLELGERGVHARAQLTDASGQRLQFGGHGIDLRRIDLATQRITAQAGQQGADAAPQPPTLPPQRPCHAEQADQHQRHHHHNPRQHGIPQLLLWRHQHQGPAVTQGRRLRIGQAAIPQQACPRHRRPRGDGRPGQPPQCLALGAGIVQHLPRQTSPGMQHAVVLIDQQQKQAAPGQAVGAGADEPGYRDLRQERPLEAVATQHGGRQTDHRLTPVDALPVDAGHLRPELRAQGLEPVFPSEQAGNGGQGVAAPVTGRDHVPRGVHLQGAQHPGIDVQQARQLVGTGLPVFRQPVCKQAHAGKQGVQLVVDAAGGKARVGGKAQQQILAPALPLAGQQNASEQQHGQHRSEHQRLRQARAQAPAGGRC